MLEFYPLPTNLNHGAGLYPHLQNHGGARFLDNPSGAASTSAATNNNSNCGQLTTSPTHASPCPQNNTSNSSNNNGNHNPLASTSASSTASLTAQAISATTTAAAATTLLLAHSASSCSSASIASSICSSSSSCSTPSCATSLSSSLSSSCSSSSASATAAASSSSSKLSADCSGRTEVGHIKCEKNFEICEGCGQKIHDRYLMNVGDSNWHEQCLACCYCGMQLHHTCYVRNSKLYCKLDYDRLFSVKCSACCHPILPQEMVMRPIPNYIFHLSCFVCYACRLPLQKGEQFLVREGQLLCYRHDLEKEMYLAAATAVGQHCGFVGLDDDDLMRPRDGRRGPKRPRTILTSQQRKQFKASFDQSPKPCRKVREALAKDTGLSVRVVQVWFQNQRAKMKKIQRKAKSGGGSGRTGANADDKDKEKDEKSSVKQELGSGSENGYLGMDSAFASQPLNPNLPFSPDDYPANSNDSFCSSDLSLDGSNFDQLDDDTDSLSLNNLELQSTGSSGNQHSNPHDMIASLNTSLINPIDKLYLMQNSYFSSEQ